VYLPRFDLKRTFVYHSANGSLGPYELTDSIALGASVESIAIHPVTGYVWIIVDRRSDSSSYPWTPNRGYAINPTTKAVVDSFDTDWDKTAAGPLPRGIAFSPGGDTLYIGHFDVATLPAVYRLVKTVVAVERLDDAIPTGYRLSQNYPNPFNPTTEIRFEVAKAGFVTLKVYDMLGREVQTLVNENLQAGSYKATFKGHYLPSGTYIYTLTANDVRLTKKMVLAK
jgi:DNA-binding beta-propeller fold protein YncE